MADNRDEEEWSVRHQSRGSAASPPTDVQEGQTHVVHSEYVSIAWDLWHQHYSSDGWRLGVTAGAPLPPIPSRSSATQRRTSAMPQEMHLVTRPSIQSTKHTVSWGRPSIDPPAERVGHTSRFQPISSTSQRGQMEAGASMHPPSASQEFFVARGLQEEPGQSAEEILAGPPNTKESRQHYRIQSEQDRTGRKFLKCLANFRKSIGKPFPKNVTVEGVLVNIYRVFEAVVSADGITQVLERHATATIRRSLNLPRSFNFVEYYKENLFEYECSLYHFSTSPELGAAILEYQHRERLHRLGHNVGLQRMSEVKDSTTPKPRQQEPNVTAMKKIDGTLLEEDTESDQVKVAFIHNGKEYAGWIKGTV